MLTVKFEVISWANIAEGRGLTDFWAYSNFVFRGHGLIQEYYANLSRWGKGIPRRIPHFQSVKKSKKNISSNGFLVNRLCDVIDDQRMIKGLHTVEREGKRVTLRVRWGNIVNVTEHGTKTSSPAIIFIFYPSKISWFDSYSILPIVVVVSYKTVSYKKSVCNRKRHHK